MKLYLLTDKVVLVDGVNPNLLCVVSPSRETVNGVMTLGDFSVTVTDGLGGVPVIPSGSYILSFKDENGNIYDGGVVDMASGGATPTVVAKNATEALLTEATFIRHLLAEIGRLSDELIDLKAKVEYQGLDFLVKGE